MATTAKAKIEKVATSPKVSKAKGTKVSTSTKSDRPDSAVDKYFNDKELKAQVATVAPAKKFKKKIITTTKAETDKKNIKDTVTKIVTSKREVKYKYPEDIIDDTAAKKTFRAKARNEDKAHLKTIDDLKKKKQDTAKAEKLYHTWRKATFLVP